MGLSSRISKRYDQIRTVLRLAGDGLMADGELSKQWYLEQILETLGLDFNDMPKNGWKRGVKPDKM